MKLSYPVDIGFYKSDAPGLALNECLNLYPSNPQTSGAASRGGLFSFPGTDLFMNLPSSGTPWGSHEFQDELYLLIQTSLFELTFYKVDSGGVFTSLGTIAITDTTNRAILDDNGVVICITLPGTNKSYFYDDTNGLEQITDLVFQDREAEKGGVRSVTFVDGYFVFNTFESIFISSLVTTNDGKNFDALDIVKPFLREDAIRVATVRGELYVFGENQIKTYSNIGGADFPFLEIPGATIDKGLIYVSALVVFDNSFFFVGGGKNERVSIWRGVGGGGVIKISTDSIDSENDSYNGSHIFSSGFMFQGRPWVVFQVNGNAKAYDIHSSSTQGRHMWIEWSRSTQDDVISSVNVIEAFGKILYIDDSFISEFNKDENQTFGSSEPRECIFSGSYLQAQSDPLIINRLELVCETGVGRDIESDPENANPKVLMEYSDDGGRTFKSAGEREIGRQGDFTKRLVWARMNRTPTSRIFKFTTNSNVPVRFIRIDIDGTKGFRNA